MANFIAPNIPIPNIDPNKLLEAELMSKQLFNTDVGQQIASILTPYVTNPAYVQGEEAIRKLAPFGYDVADLLKTRTEQDKNQQILSEAQQAQPWNILNKELETLKAQGELPWNILQTKAGALKAEEDLPTGAFGQSDLAEQEARTNQTRATTKSQQYADQVNYWQANNIKYQALDQQFKNASNEEVLKHRPYITAIQGHFSKLMGAGASDEQALGLIIDELESMDPNNPERAVALNALALSGIPSSILEKVQRSGGRGSSKKEFPTLEDLTGEAPPVPPPSEALSAPPEESVKSSSSDTAEPQASTTPQGWPIIQNTRSDIRKSVNDLIPPKAQDILSEAAKVAIDKGRAAGNYVMDPFGWSKKEPEEIALLKAVGRTVLGMPSPEEPDLPEANTTVSTTSKSDTSLSETDNIEKALSPPKKPDEKATKTGSKQAATWRKYNQDLEDYNAKQIEMRKNPERFKKGIQFQVRKDGITGRAIWVPGTPLKHSFEDATDVLMSDNKLFNDLGLGGTPGTLQRLTRGLVGSTATKSVFGLDKKDIDPQSKEIIDLTKMLLNHSAFQTDVLGELRSLVDMQRQIAGSSDAEINRDDMIKSLRTLVAARISQASGRSPPKPQF